MDTIILGIESSCDDTSAAILQNGDVLSNVVANQDVHIAYGGVVPELASRAHQANIIPVVHQAMQQAGVTVGDLSGIAFTRGPGLIGPLLVGTMFAKGLALARNIPLIEVHHMHAHIVAHLIDDPVPDYPFLCLTVSGGHTQIVRVDGPLQFEQIGATLDDAAGEAFDKTAKLLGLPYPGGPLIDKYAREGNPDAYKFPEPKIDGLDFSFSGLKTAILYFLEEESAKDPMFTGKHMADICASVQSRIVSILMHKLEKAAEQTGITNVAIAGGVSANSGLRSALEEYGERNGWQTFIPAFQYCTDNAAMIAMTGYLKYQGEEFVGQEIAPMARMPV